MPAGVPVATVSVAGGANAGLLAVRILAAGDPALQERMRAYQAGLVELVDEKDRRLQAERGEQ
jgi:5-(carboxyamino)imidazole ribonucleotide mutase